MGDLFEAPASLQSDGRRSCLGPVDSLTWLFWEGLAGGA
jgi:hypothetical protein